MEKGGGLEAMLYDLLRRDISKINLRKVPRTQALLSQIIESFDSVQQFWFERLLQGTLLDAHSEWPKKIKTSDLYNAYLAFCKNLRCRNTAVVNTFMKKIKTLCPGLKRIRPTVETNRRKYFLQMPKLHVCRKNFEKSLSIEIDWNQD